MPASGITNLLSLPAYTTITAQAFSRDGKFLAVGSDTAKIAIFNVVQIVESESKKASNGLVFQFDSACCLDKGIEKGGSVNDIVSFEGTLVVAISRASGTAAVLAFQWKDLIQQRSTLAWSIDSSSGLLPKDINSLDIDRRNEKLIIGGGLGTATDAIDDYALRVVDLETRRLSSKPLLGHKGYLHSVEHCELSDIIASSSEDGSVRTWDRRLAKDPCITVIKPYQYTELQRPKLGSWISDVSICGDWLICGGGPKPAIFHLKALASPSVIPELPEDSCFSQVFVTKIVKNKEAEDRVLIAGQFSGGGFYQYSLDGTLKAEVKTSSSCLYSIETTFQDTFKMLSAGGSSSTLDLCTHNLSYSDNAIQFPTFQ